MIVEILAFMFVFSVGFFAGVGTLMAYGLYQVRKIKESKKNLTEDLKKKNQEMEQKTNSIRERLVKAGQIAQAQNDLRAQSEMPSKNGLHSKYKNGLVAEIAVLEQEKLSILKTILAEGFNPMITMIQGDGLREEVPLSKYVEEAQVTVDEVIGKKTEEIPPPLPEGANEGRRVGKFFIYKGGKDDGTTH